MTKQELFGALYDLVASNQGRYTSWYVRQIDPSLNGLAHSRRARAYVALRDMREGSAGLLISTGSARRLPGKSNSSNSGISYCKSSGN